MINSGGKKVVFRIAGIGFSLDVDNLVEVKEAIDFTIDTSSADPEVGLLGLVSVREEAVHLLDIRGLLGLPAAVDDSVLMIVLGTDGAWVFPVEKIIGIALPGELQNCATPPLLTESGNCPFISIDIWKDEPLVCFDPVLIEQYRVSS